MCLRKLKNSKTFAKTVLMLKSWKCHESFDTKPKKLSLKEICNLKLIKCNSLNRFFAKEKTKNGTFKLIEHYQIVGSERIK